MRTALQAAGMALGAPSIVRAAADRPLRTAVIGVGGRCVNHWSWLKADTQVTALCDVDSSVFTDTDPQYRRAAQGRTPAKLWPNAKRYTDYRELFEQAADSFDAVVVCTPDHHHYGAVLRAIRAGKAVFCEKPLTWSIQESRVLAEETRKHRVATQLGNQGTGTIGWRLAHGLYHGGAIGKVKAVHAWIDRAQNANRLGRPRPDGTDPIPEGLDWDVWLGPAPHRPYKAGIYHPKKWRSWCDFSNSTLGDFGCHTLNAFFRVLEPGCPESVEIVDSTPFNRESWPEGQIVRWRFPETGERPAFDLHWYEGKLMGRVPLPETMRNHNKQNGGMLIEGDKGAIYLVGSHNASAMLVPESARKAWGRPRLLVPESRGHFKEFVMAAKKQLAFDAPLSHFGFAGPMTATLIMGNVAALAGKKLLVDPKTGRIKNLPGDSSLLMRRPRPGWAGVAD